MKNFREIEKESYNKTLFAALKGLELTAIKRAYYLCDSEANPENLLYIYRYVYTDENVLYA